jgi:catechol 2,3-dioxygenase-like lactoylglutathione lyase family enzyme
MHLWTKPIADTENRADHVFKKLDCVCIHTTDLDTSLQFYLQMGLREAWRLERITEVGIPWTLVGCDIPGAGSSQLVVSTHPDRRITEVEILVDDVQAAFESLSSNPQIRWIAEPFATENGHVAVMTAPDGNDFVLIGR